MFVWFVQKLNSSGGLSKVRFVEFCSDSENENFESFAAKNEVWTLPFPGFHLRIKKYFEFEFRKKIK